MVDATDLKSVEPYKLVRVRVSLPPSIEVYLSLPPSKNFFSQPYLKYPIILGDDQ